MIVMALAERITTLFLIAIEPGDAGQRWDCELSQIRVIAKVIGISKLQILQPNQISDR